ncbi:[protein-PII] uridylyltransferase [Solimicrobium silvestre]|uniref:Bifunctional uridylyltransferase/uridylyl-removing enzyme n=1 Tax=Solimicrobium silvestre TaxID=2099400 RepID=A0A2S9GWP6_9BURK|nr:[protein-PII] uridylyltransferase [Solimicrobium silvestre]PRC92142.1 Protein-P-II uridylyltransferase [Solimicrobium silvestre]
MQPLAQKLKEQLKARHQLITAAFSQNQKKPEALLHDICHSVDTALIELWQALALPNDVSLIGVGGYGRGELFPYSDVDVLVLLPHAADDALRVKLELLVQQFWDLGLEIGHSIRTIDECLQESKADITVQTSLLEARLVTGSRKSFRALREHYNAAMNPQAFFQAKTLELRQRHVKFEDTPYSLEPNCKESPGGLRDLQVILWISKAAKLGNSWSELAARGLITGPEARQLRRNERAFKDIRIRLHIFAKRREDRLVFDVQTPIAETFGFVATPTRRSSEYLMQRYYWAAKAVTQLNTILLQNIEAQLFISTSKPHAINADFNEINGFIEPVDPQLFEHRPSAMLELYLLLSQQTELKGMSAPTMRALWHARFKINSKFRRDPINHDLFLQILQAPQGVTHALRGMNQMSILGRYLPNFRRIIGQMQHDLFHVYTVDQHILMVVRNLRRFTMPEHAHEYPFCSQLIANFPQHWVLYVAALFHDIAKGRNGDHSHLGGEDARRFCRQHGMAKDKTELVVFLVEHHLLMSQVAQKQDLSDPEVIQHFAKVVKDERHLTALYLLTVSDIRGTSPKVWNAWKGKLLEDLYHLTLRALGGEIPSPDRELKNRQDEALKNLRLYGLPENAHAELWKQLDVVYFLRNDASDIVWQTRVFYDKVNSEKPAVKCRTAPIGEGLQVAVYIKDQPDLFARICSYFDAKSFSILDAKIHTTQHDYALDTFLISASAFSKNYRDIINLVEHELTKLLSSQTALPVPSKGRLSRLSRTFPITPTVGLLPDERGQYYLLSVTANDRNGLLYSIAKVLAKYKINLHTAKIMTLGERVEDVFLIDGAALQNSRTQIQLETDLLDALTI